MWDIFWFCRLINLDFYAFLTFYGKMFKLLDKNSTLHVRRIKHRRKDVLYILSGFANQSKNY